MSDQKWRAYFESGLVDWQDDGRVRCVIIEAELDEGKLTTCLIDNFFGVELEEDEIRHTPCTGNDDKDRMDMWRLPLHSITRVRLQTQPCVSGFPGDILHELMWRQTNYRDQEHQRPIGTKGL